MKETNKTKTVKFAVVGCGHIGKRHAAVINANPACELLALCDSGTPDEGFLNQYEVPFFSSLEGLLTSDLEIDVVNICTPNAFHARQTIQCLEAGKHVVCEKPMGLSREECERMISKSFDTSRQIFCVMQNRYASPSIWIKELVDQKRLGDILMVQVNCYWNRDDRYYKPGGQQHPWHGKMDLDRGTLFTQFSHFIDAMYWLFGDIKNIKSRLANFSHRDSTEFEDSGMVQFEFVNGGLGCFNYSTAVWDANLESSLTVIGSKGSVKIGGQYMSDIQHCHIEGYELSDSALDNPVKENIPFTGSTANLWQVIQNVVEVLNSSGQSIKTNALEGMKVVDIIERIYENGRKNL